MMRRCDVMDFKKFTRDSLNVPGKFVKITRLSACVFSNVMQSFLIYKQLTSLSEMLPELHWNCRNELNQAFQGYA